MPSFLLFPLQKLTDLQVRLHCVCGMQEVICKTTASNLQDRPHCVLQVCRLLRAEADIAWQRLSLAELTLRSSVRLLAFATSSASVQSAALQMPACSVVVASQECIWHSCRCLLAVRFQSSGNFLVPRSPFKRQITHIQYTYIWWGGAALR